MPGEVFQADPFVDPDGRSLFEFAKDVGEAVRWLEANEQVDVVGDSADALGRRVKTADGSAEVFVEAGAPVVGDCWGAMFCGEDEVVMEAREGGRHGV